MVGGGGADILRGDDGEDLLIGGHAGYFDRYTQAADRTALTAAWFSAETYAERINRRANTGGTGAAEQIKLTPGSMVHDDGHIDTLFGESGLDGFSPQQLERRAK